MDAVDELLRKQAERGGSRGVAGGGDGVDKLLQAHVEKGAPSPATAAGSPQRMQAAEQPVQRPAGPTMGQAFLNGIPKGAAGFLDAIPNAGINLANLGIAAYGMGKHALTGSTDFPDLIAPDKLSGYSKLGHLLGLIDDREPQDAAGRMASTMGEILGGGGLNPAAIGRSAAAGRYMPIVRDAVAAIASGGGSGAASELARNVHTGSDAADNLLKALASVGGGAAAGGFFASRGTAGDRVAAATHGVIEAQWAAAQRLVQQAAAAGSPITGYEALQAITGLNPKMQTQQRVAEQSDAAGGGLTQLMQNRPGANAALFGNAVDSVAPMAGAPDTLAGRLQTSAQGAIDDARQAGNTRAAPFYAQSSNDPNVMVPPHVWNTLTQDPAIADALRQVQRNPLGGMQNAQPGSLMWLDAAKKYLDSQGTALGIQGQRFFAGNAGDAASAITGAVDPVVPAYGKARRIVADNMQNVVEPMEQGQIGKLAGSDVFPTQAETLLPNKPTDVTPQVIQNTANAINPQDPNVMRQFVAQFLRSQYNEASQQNIAGPNVFGGSKFAAQVAGNPAQEQNLVAALTSSGATPDQMMSAIQIFRAQGMKPPVNSATAANANEGAAMAGGLGGFTRNPISTALGLVTGPIDSWRNGSAASDLAAALSSGGNSVNDLAGLARVNGAYNPTQQQVMANLLKASPQPTTDPYEAYLKAWDAAPTMEEKKAISNAYRATWAPDGSQAGP